MSHTVPISICPGCGEELFRADPGPIKLGREPKPGDTAQCCYCDALLTFTGEMGLRRQTAADVERMKRTI